MKKYSRVYLEITNVCNKNCSFCLGTDRPRRFMSADEFNLALSKLKGVTDYLYFHLMGEPLLHPELKNFIKTANGSDFHPCITTNGSLLPRFGDDLIEAGVYKVNVSVHSFEGDVSSKLDEYLDGIIDFADKASSAGVLVVIRLWNVGKDSGRNDYIIERLKARFADPWVFGSRGARIRHRLHLDYAEQFDWPDLSLAELGDKVYCHGLDDHFGVLCDGTVVPCCLDRQGDISLGNLFLENVEDILKKDRTKAIEQGFANSYACEELCRKCGYARRFKTK